VQVAPYVNFSGNCREAFEFYKDVLNAELPMMLTHHDMPMEGIPEEWKDKIVHAHLQVGDQAIMGSDAPPEMYSPPTSMWVSLHLQTVSETERIYAALSEGGSITMPVGPTEWAASFAMFTDRFGVPWILNCDSDA
jgi:PhnB protein